MKIVVTSSDGSIWEGLTNSVVRRYTGWRCLHQAEGGYPNPDRMPIVRPSVNAPSVGLSEPLQRVDFRINRANALYTGKKWRSTNHTGIAFCNGNGFEDPSDPRVDYVNLEDMSSPLPRRMKAIICGGNFFTGKTGYSTKIGLSETLSAFKSAARNPKEFMRNKRHTSLFQAVRKSMISALVTDNILILTPGVDAIDATKPFSDIDAWAEVILYNHWYFHATTRNGDKINNFPQGEGGPVLVGLFLIQAVVYPLSWFERWDSTELPDPLKVYSPL